MQRKKILWLVSWYPNKNDRFDGDFIQRHARAAAVHHDIHVIFITDADINEAVEEDWNYVTGLTEQIVYFKRRKGIFNKLRKQFVWRNLYLEAAKNYFQKNGKPAWLHVHVPWKSGLIALELKNKHGVGYLLTEHWGIYNTTADGNFFSQPSYVKRFLKKIFRESRAFISVSKYLAEGVNRMVIQKDYNIIPNVVDTSLFFYKNEKYSAFSFIHVSNMVPLKNVKGLLDAFHLLSQKTSGVQLILVGNRDRTYVKYAEELGLLNRSVIFRGEISYVEVAREMQAAHCLVLNSHIENAPCVISEALCCGLPVIATDIGGIPEMVSSSNGILIAPGDAEALSRAMWEMKESYQNYDQAKIALESSQKYSYSAISQAFHDLYETAGRAKEKSG